MSDELFFENGKYKGMKDSEGRYFNDRGDLVAQRQSDGSVYDYRTGSIWRKERSE